MTETTALQCRCGLPMAENGTCAHCDTGLCPLCATYGGKNCELAQNLGKGFADGFH